MFNFTNVTSATNFPDLIAAESQLTNNVLGTVIVIGLWLITYASLKRYDNESAFLTTCFIMSLVGMLFRAMSLVSDNFIVLMFLLTMIGFFFKHMK